MKIEKDIEIPLRDGARLRADVFRPQSASRVPVIRNLGIYQKDKTWTPPDDLEEKANPQMVLGDRESIVVGAPRLCPSAGRCARIR